MILSAKGTILVSKGSNREPCITLLATNLSDRNIVKDASEFEIQHVSFVKDTSLSVLRKQRGISPLDAIWQLSSIRDEDRQLPQVILKSGAFILHKDKGWAVFTTSLGVSHKLLGHATARVERLSVSRGEDETLVDFRSVLEFKNQGHFEKWITLEFKF